MAEAAAAAATQDLGCIIRAFISRTLVGTGALYLLDMDGMNTMHQVKIAAVVSAGSIASQRWVEPALASYGKGS